MYTITVKIAANGTIYHSNETSVTGHMWYSISDGTSTESHGFAPLENGSPMGDGWVYPDDDANYGSTYYTGTIVIDYNQYAKLQQFGITANLSKYGFSDYYNGLTNSCIDYTWKALNIIGLNPSNFEGQTWPTWNADDADVALYKYLMGNTSEWHEGWPDAGDYHVIYGSSGGDILIAQNNTDALYGGRGDDSLFGNNLDNYMEGGTDNDTLVGGTGSDGLVGGTGNDTLIGTNGYGGDDGVNDTLNGGAGFDTYISGNNDVIYDSDGLGMIVFEGKLLKGVDVTMDSTIYPSGQDHTAYYSKEDRGTYYRNENIGFSFVSDSGTTITVYSPLDYTKKIIPKPGGGTMTQTTYRGVGVILENFSSPLVLDLNHDGVTSLDLYATPAYFDMEGDGIREKTGWIQSTDALLAFDKNRDGIINDGSELFGNYTTLANGTKASNGFEALEQYDNNHDGMIDKNDSVYNALSAWIDTNQDGVTDSGELHSLSEMEVTSINLNATTTTAYEDQNAITHTSIFTQQTADAEGNTITETNAVNDVWFRKDTTNTLSTVTISDTVAALPQINGSGRVLDLHGAIENRAALKMAIEPYLNLHLYHSKAA